MAVVSITPANVLPTSLSVKKKGTAGEAIVQGRLVYLDPVTSTYKKTDPTNVATALCDGIALNSAGVGQPIVVLASGTITIGGTLAQGVAYFAGAEATGDLIPVDDVAALSIAQIFVGFALSTSVLTFTPISSGFVQPS